MRRPTIRDVAADSGVSRATVSLVLRDSPQIAEATKQRVRESMARLGYVYNRRAADMRNQQSRTLGLVVTTVRNPYFAELMMSIEQVAHQAGYTLLQGYSLDETARQRKLLETMAEHRIDGLVLLPAHGSRPEDLLETAGIPHVLVARSIPGYQSDYAGADNVVSGRLVGEHLAAINVGSVAFAGGPAASTARSDRLNGLRQALRAADVPVIKDLPIGRQSGADLVAEVLSGGCPDAIVAYSDMYAFGIVNGLRAHGVEPGRDVAVASFDDVPDAAVQQPGLTSAAGFPDRVGAEAARLLLDRMGDPARPPRRVLIDPRLSVRESTTLWPATGRTPL
ncbi:LacI family DNA-binding transcriptional regulator [Nonomuraea sp. NPDC049480]|uniref:LacI family DNA-binding transcriptional regulator n=1 Tax=Nonomuraea sp. NPDC049480 TaxID=3364353 RepID=UPI003795D9D0